MGKKKDKKRFEREVETNSPAETQTDLTLLNAAGDSHRKKKPKTKSEKETNGETKKADDIPTVTVPIAGSIVDNAQSLEWRKIPLLLFTLSTLCYKFSFNFSFFFQLVVVFDNKSSLRNNGAFLNQNNSNENDRGAAFIVRILQYLETPQYLRKALFVKHNSLRYVGMLPPLDAPHHLRKHEWAPNREGVTLEEKPTSSAGTVVDVGLDKNVVVDQALGPGKRVTVAMGTNQNLDYGNKIGLWKANWS
ncbi:putative methyltransferase C9orf114 [Gossypium hirsutum]|uniref:Methyltransferase C9orf114 n=1 Tax=Gossypium hirsutum TaxID=3635 RepID=A0ABM2ZNN4_GOSHI|nr:putative methyltransferase C9orf114 [Gossypium hirsutum]